MIAICTNPYRDEGLKLTNKAVKMLNDAGFDTFIYKVFQDDSADFSDSSLIVVIGGDGTILKVADELRENIIPIVGVNLGTKGFMACIEPEDIELILEAAKGNYLLSKRMRLDVFLNDKFVGSCLNDAVIHGYGDCISLSAECDSTSMISFSGDGIVLSTPTGSTGYSMSAGGPVVEPEARCVIVSPICSHSFGSRSFVLDNSRTVTVTAEKLHDRKAYLSLDGNINFDLNNHDRVQVKESSFDTYMASLGIKSFYETVFQKLT